MKSRITRRLGAASLATATVVAGGILTIATGASTSASAASAGAVSPVTITPNPRAAGQPFQGWGTSLAWFANATGGYPAALRNQLYDAVFGKDGLDLNIARYNIGGGNASDVADYLRPGAAVQGYWKADPDGSGGTYGGAATTVASKSQVLAAFEPDNDADYDWSADPTQRWWVQKLASDNRITHWEAFANSAPYFMTQSGYVSGNTTASKDNLEPTAYDKYAGYLTHVTDHLEQQYGISFDSIEPFNESNTGYWGTKVTNGVPSGSQEGMQVTPSVQTAVVPALSEALASASTKARVAAMDETSTSNFLTDWAAYNPAIRSDVARLNVHTYGTGSAVQVRDAAKAAKKPLWMSEVEGSWVNGYDPVNIANGLGLAQKINDDLRTLQPEAWTLWQPVENLYNMEKTEKLNWGELDIDFDCQPYDVAGQTVWKSAQRVADAGGDPSAAPDCGIQYNSKYNAMRNYTHFIHEGDRLVPTNDTTSTAAIGADGTGASIVHTNATSDSQAVTVDLSDFGSIAAGATVTPYVTTQGTSATDPDTNALIKGAAVAIDPVTMTATITVPAHSITSFVVSGASGVSDTAPGLLDGHTYQLVGMQSGKALTAPATATTITTPATTATAASTQEWTAHAVPAATAGDSGPEFVLTTADDRVLGATTAGTDLRTVPVGDGVDDPHDRWMLETTDGKNFSLVNEAISQALDVGGQATAENSPVGVYGSNGGSNQAWSPRDLAPNRQTTIAAHTTAGTAPSLPATAAPSYNWGVGAPVPVTWDMPPAATWEQAGQVVVSGTGTDVFGNAFTVRATVDVGDFTTVNPSSIAVYAGTRAADVRAEAPTTVQARVGDSDQTFTLPATWDFSSVTDADVATAGTVVPVNGTADDGSGTALPATLWILVTTPGVSNLLPSATAVASSTESGYPISNTTNGVLTDKGWSNWVSSNKPTQSSLTYTFKAAHALQDAKVYFYKDGTNVSWAKTIQFLYQDPDSGTWVPVPGYETAVPVASPADGSAPIVTATFAQPITATGIKVVMNVPSGSYLTVSEVQAHELQASATADTDLGAIRVGAQQLPDVSGAVHSYTVQSSGSAYPTVQGFAIDPAASVRVVQPSDANDGTATITVDSSDGSATTTYDVKVDRAVNLASVGISGAAEPGKTVQAVVNVDPQGADLSYQWYAGDMPIDGAQAASYSIPDHEPVGTPLSVQVTASADGFAGTPTQRSAAVQVQPSSTDSSLADLEIGGRTIAGFSPGTLSYDYTSPTGEFPVVSGAPASAAASVHVDQAAVDNDSLATLTVTARDGSTTTYTVQVTRTASVSAVAVAPAPRVGTATSVTATTSPADAGATYRWAVGGVPVPGATASSYTPRPQDAGRTLTVTVTASGPHLVTGRTTSAPMRVRLGTIEDAQRPTIQGVPAVGERLHAVTGSWTLGAVVHYAWYTDTSMIRGATDASLELTNREAGKRIHVVVTASRAGYVPHSETSIPTAVVTRAAVRSDPGHGGSKNHRREG